MTIKIFGNTFDGCGTGISAPKDANIEIGANQFVSCGKAIDLRDPPSLMQAMGLKHDTPIPLVCEILTFAASSQSSDLQLHNKAESIGLLKWLSAGADASTLITTMAGLYPHIPTILAMLGK